MGEFWDTHSSADYWDQGDDVDIEVRMLRRRSVAIEAEIYNRVTEAARQRGVTPETLINLWIADRMNALASTPAESGAHGSGVSELVQAQVKQVSEESASYKAED